MNKIEKYIKSFALSLLLLFILNILNEFLPNELMNFTEYPLSFVVVYLSIIYLISKKE